MIMAAIIRARTRSKIFNLLVKGKATTKRQAHAGHCHRQPLSIEHREPRDELLLGSVPTAAAAVAGVLARRPLCSLHALLDRVAVVAFVPQLALEVVGEYLQRLTQLLEARLRDLLARAVVDVHLVRVQFEGARPVRLLDLGYRGDGGHAQQLVQLGALHLAHLKVGAVVGVLDLDVVFVKLDQGRHVCQGLLVPVERVQCRGARERGGFAL
mmetsp:Transcript_27100/g.68513  ORF Transcript_27100/g.68513 Transcript_27100/m.68513 type:complete len:212 (+) Transcript_27100:76-711(+)